MTDHSALKGFLTDLSKMSSTQSSYAKVRDYIKASAALHLGELDTPPVVTPPPVVTTAPPVVTPPPSTGTAPTRAVADANSGPTGALVTVNSDLYLDQDNMVVTGQDIHGMVYVRAHNVTLRNFKCQGILNVFWDGNYSATFEDGLIDGQNSSDNGAQFGVYTFRRCEFTRAVDGAKFGPSSYFYDCFFHDNYIPSGAHADSMQSTGNGDGSPSWIERCWLDMPMMLGDEDSPLTTITIKDTYMGGGLWGGWNQATQTHPSALTITGCTISNVLYVHPSTVWSNNVNLSGQQIPHP